MVDIFAVQQEIAQSVARATVRKGFAPATRPITTNLTGYDYYLQGLFHFQRIDVGGLPQAVGAFEMALAADPQFAAAYAWIARSYRFAAQYGLSPAKAFPLARENVRKALALDAELAIAHSVQGSVSLYSDWDWPAAERAFRKATAINPSDGNAHHDFAHYLIAMRRFDQAFEESQKQIAVNPIDVEAMEHAAFHHIITGDAARAIPATERALALNPCRENALRYRRRALELSGQFEEAARVRTADVGASPQLAQTLCEGWKKEGATGYWCAWRDYTRAAEMSEDLRAR